MTPPNGARPSAPRRRCLPIAIVAAVLSASWPSPSRGDGDRDSAAAAFREGGAAFARGDYRAAGLAFDEAYRHRPHGATAYNAGLAWEAAGEPARAADDYDAAVRLGGLQPAEATDATRRLRALERSLGRVDVSGPDGAHVSLAHVERAPLPARIHVAPGAYAVDVSFAEGQTAARPIAVAAGAILPLSFTEPTPASTGATPKSTPPAPTASAPSVLPPPDRSSSSSVLPALAVSVLGGAAVAAGTAVGLGTAALAARDDYNESSHTDLDAYDRAATLRTWTNVAWVSAASLAVVGGVLVVVAVRSKHADGRARAGGLRIESVGSLGGLRF